MESVTFTHLPDWASRAIGKYESDVADGTLTFSAGEFADESPDTLTGWVGSHLSQHVSGMDIS